MGIHVSFKGSNGRRINMDYDGSDASMDKLQEFAAAHAVKAPEDKIPLKMPEKKSSFNEQGLVAIDTVDTPGFLEAKLAPFSSLEASKDKHYIQLVGDDMRLNKERPLFYSRENDKPAWNPVSVLDPAEKGKHVGPSFGDLSLDTNDGSMDPDSGATSRTYLSRIATEFKTADASAQFVIYGFYFTQYRTKFGRIIAESPESRAVIAAIDLSKIVQIGLSSILGGGKGLGTYGTRAYFKDAVGTGILPGTQVLTHLAYGPDDLLASLPDEFSTDPDEDWTFLRDPVDKDGNSLKGKVHIVPVFAASTFYGFEGKNTLVDDDSPESD